MLQEAEGSRTQNLADTLFLMSRRMREDAAVPQELKWPGSTNTAERLKHLDVLCRMRELLAEALTAEDDAAVLQELARLEGVQVEEDARKLPAVPALPEVWAALTQPDCGCYGKSCCQEHIIYTDKSSLPNPVCICNFLPLTLQVEPGAPELTKEEREELEQLPAVPAHVPAPVHAVPAQAALKEPQRAMEEPVAV